jgi:hypothetical protein
VTHERLLAIIYEAIKAEMLAEQRYERALEVRIKAQRDADDLHATLCNARADLQQALDALRGTVK